MILFGCLYERTVIIDSRRLLRRLLPDRNCSNTYPMANNLAILPLCAPVVESSFRMDKFWICPHLFLYSDDARSELSTLRGSLGEQTSLGNEIEARSDQGC